MKTLFSLLGVLSISGCATILQPGPDKVMVTSEPAGAQIFLDEQPVGVTPAQISFNRAGEGVLRLQKEGYRTVVLDKDKVVAGWVFLDLLFWPAVIVDLATHNQGKYSEDPIYIPMGRASDHEAMKMERSSEQRTRR